MADDDTVPKARFEEVIAARRAADDRVRDLETQLRDAQAAAARVDALDADVTRYRAMEAGWADERAILAAGITEPEGVETARFAWGRVPAASRPKGGLGEWLGARDALPKGVQAYLPAAAPAAPPAADPGAPPAAPAAPAVVAGAGPRPVVPTQSPAAGGRPYTPAQIAQLAADVAGGRATKEQWDAAVAATMARPGGAP
jgi:hypothetical protein